jgi:hypothetical protein
MRKELKSGWYNKKLQPIKPKDEEIGAILFVTKDFESLYDFIKKFDYNQLKKYVQYAKNDLIIDVFDGWIDTTIRVYAKIDYKKRHKDYLKMI